MSTNDKNDKRLKILGQNLKQLRKSKNISQLNLAIKTGITREHLSKIERGIVYPSMKLLFEIADELKVQIKSIINF